MIEILKKMECCGCEACAQICPKQCINMKQDNEGFFYPEVDKNKCVNCNKCNKVCPIKNPSKRNNILKAYATQIIDEKIRMASSSGGAFSNIAEYIFRRKGIVFGAIFDKDLNVIHSQAKNMEELNLMRGSKYVQSRILDTYKEAEKYLKEDKYVCYSGTPCQIEGLVSYLGKTYEKLITIDLVCHGVPSPKVWRKYIDTLEKNNNSKVTFYNFRSKKTGFHNFGTEIKFENGEEFYSCDSSDKKDFMHLAFFQEICSRPSCHDCKFKTKERISDFTIFDCWSVEKFSTTMEDDKGTSMIFLHTDKALKIFNEIKDKLNYCVADIQKVIELDGVNVIYSMKPNPKRREFFESLDNMTIEELQEEYLKEKKNLIIIKQLKIILKKLGIFELVKKWLYLVTRPIMKKRL